jgi:hypothetical protein
LGFKRRTNKKNITIAMWWRRSAKFKLRWDNWDEKHYFGAIFAKVSHIKRFIEKIINKCMNAQHAKSTDYFKNTSSIFCPFNSYLMFNQIVSTPRCAFFTPV